MGGSRQFTLRDVAPSKKRALIAELERLIAEGEPLSPWLAREGLRDAHLCTILRWRDLRLGFDSTKPTETPPTPKDAPV